MANLIPGGKALSGWTSQYGGLTLVNGASPTGLPAFEIDGPINADVNNRMNSSAFGVIPGGIYSLRAYLDATYIGTNYAGFQLANASTLAVLGGFNQYQVVKGYYTVNVTIPAGVTSALVQAYLGFTTVGAGTMQWSEPDVELVGFSISMTEASFSPIPFLSFWQQGSANIPVFSDGNYLYIPFVGGPGDPAFTYEWYGVLKINATGWCAFVTQNTPNFTPGAGNSSVGGYGITFDGSKTFTFSNGNFFARFAVPSVFQPGRVFRFPFAGTPPPANACGGTGYFSNIYSAGGKTVLEYIEDFAQDSHIWAQVLESGISADLGFVANGQPDPLFNPPITSATQGTLFPNPPLTYNGGGLNITIGPSAKYGGSLSLLQSYSTQLNASNSGGCSLNKITIETSQQGIVDCLDIATGSFEAFALFGDSQLIMAYDATYSTRFVMTRDFSRFYYYSSNFPGGAYGPKGNGILGGTLFTFANNNIGPVHVFTGTVPAFPTSATGTSIKAVTLTNSTRPVSPIGAFIT